ncbi:MAG: YihY/virulence factor BrkB family protein [Edaphobacter sp.]
MRSLLRLPRIFHGAILRAMRHDCFNLAQSASYAAMVALFPALIVAAAVIGFLPDTAPLRFQLSAFFDRILPPDVSPFLQSYFVESPHSTHSARAVVVAFLVSLTGATSVLATLMEGVRRANDLPVDCWSFWQRRRRALLLVPLSVIPFGLASLILVFGQFATHWLAFHITPSVRPSILFLAILIRWVISLTASVGITALIYHLGSPMQQHWKRTLPGAVISTLMWFIATVAFGWYVTRFANYSQVYGSLGVAIALLFWLNIISLCVLAGAEFNAEFRARFLHSHRAHSASRPPNSLPSV